MKRAPSPYWAQSDSGKRTGSWCDAVTLYQKQRARELESSFDERFVWQGQSAIVVIFAGSEP